MKAGTVLELVQLPLIEAIALFAVIAFRCALDSLVSKDDDRVYYFFAIIALSLLTLLYIKVAIARTLLAKRDQSHAGKSWGVRQCIYIAIASILLLVAWFAPAITINIDEDYAQLVAGRRYAEGKWGEAMTIYLLIRHYDSDSVRNICEMKMLLTQAGYYEKPIDAVPNRHILKALDRLQIEYSLKNDRFVGPKTRTILYARAHRDELNLDAVSNPSYETIRAAVIKVQQKHHLLQDGYIGCGSPRFLDR
jgi:hypothetical protein